MMSNYGHVVDTMLTESTFSFGAFASAFGALALDGDADGVDFELVAESLIEWDSSVPVMSTWWPTWLESLLSSVSNR